ncbi:hypothetical protein [Bacteroidaceae bacterium]|jgi:ABC-type maltose transport system permease subunit|nr:hypothetical protein [Bacteroides sp.]
MKKVALSILKFLMVILFICYYVGNTAFIHTHTFQNYTITHSHPFIPGAHHGHSSDGEVETIAFLNAFLALAVPAIAVVFQLAFLQIIVQFYSLITSFRKVFSHLLRAPPVAG